MESGLREILWRQVGAAIDMPSRTPVNACPRELSAYLRHVQHHAAQLDLLLRQTVGDGPRWVRKAT